jgi:hypothetical protein
MIPCERNGFCIYPEEDFMDSVIGFSESELVSKIKEDIAELAVNGDPNWSIQSFEFDTEEV